MTITPAKVITLCIALSLADFGVTILCSRLLGWGLTYALFAVPMLTGLLIQWRRWHLIKIGHKLYENLSHIEKLKAEPRITTQILCWFLTTILLLIPGLVTSSIGFATMVNPLKGWIERPIYLFHRHIAKMKIRQYKEKENSTGKESLNKRINDRLKAKSEKELKELMRKAKERN